MPRTTNIMLTVAAVAIVSTVADSVSARSAYPRKTVSVGKLDLRKADDVAKFKKRVKSAAVFVCTHDVSGRWVGPSAYDRATCVKESLASAMPTVDALVASAERRGGAARARMADTDAGRAMAAASRP